MDDETPEQPEDDRIEAATWFGLSLLTWSVLISIGLHSSVLIPSFIDLGPRGEADIDIEWLQSFDRLEGIGHGSSGRWAEVDESSFQTKQEEPDEPEAQPEPEPEVQPEPEPEPEPQEEPAPEPEAKPKPKPREVAATEKRALKPPTPKPEKPKTARQAYSSGDLPGLDRAGPNNLPAMEGYGPGNTVFSALVRFDRIRGTEFADPVRKLMEAVPDYRIVLEGTGVDPVDDIDSMFMASANPVYIDETFLAVRHRMSQGVLRSSLDRRFDQQIPWSTYKGFPVRDLVPKDSAYNDPRRVMIAADGFALIAQPEWMAELTSTLPEDSDLVRGVDTKALEKAPTMLDGLEFIERAAEADDTIVLVSAMGARLVIPGVGRVTLDGAKLRVTNINRPKLTIDMAFGGDDEAAKFARECPALKDRLLGRVPWIARNITRMVIDRLTCEASGPYVAIEGQYSREEAQRLLNIATPFMPRPPILSKLPPGPPRALPSADENNAPQGDAGTAAAEPDAGTLPLAEPPAQTPTEPPAEPTNQERVVTEPAAKSAPVEPSEGDDQDRPESEKRGQQ